MNRKRSPESARIAFRPPESPAADAGSLRGEQGFSFAGFRLEAEGTLFRGEELVHLPPKELAALRLLLLHAGQIVTAQQLRKDLWSDVHVTADSVPKCVSSLRARLEPEDCIQTVYKRGYRFSAEVQRHRAEPTGQLPRLAIMPFATGYAVPEHLGQATADEAIAQLSNARHPVATVLARDSVFTLTRRGLTALELGETLKANLVLTGTVSALPSHFRLRTEMIRVEDGAQIWVEDMLAQKSHVAGLEAELGQRLAFRLGAGGLSISASAQDGRGPQHREAYESFQRGRYEWQTLKRHRMQDGLQHLAHAAELDPSLISAKVDLVHLCVTQALLGFMSPSVAAELVHRTAESVSEFPHRGEALLPALGWVNFHWDHNLPAALWAFRLSEHLPHDPWTTSMRAMFELSRHRFAEAAELLRGALELDPYSPSLHSRLAWALHLSGQGAESVGQIRKALGLFPDHEGTNLYGSIILAYNGDPILGTKLAQELAERQPSFDLPIAVNAYSLACEGRNDEARTTLERLQWLSRERFVLRSFTAAAYVALGDNEAALAELQAVAESRCPWFFQMLADPRLKPLHGRPEFEEMNDILTHMEATVANQQKQ